MTILSPDEYFMKQAFAEACLAAKEDEAPVGAVLVCGDRIIARAHNRTERLNDPTAHAEILAITAATAFLGAKYLPGCRLYVTLEPCIMCAGAIGWSQLAALIYGAPDEKRGFTRYAPCALHPTTEIRSGVMANECATLLRDFFRNKR
jgi:tRNA(adenine34) deaminase